MITTILTEYNRGYALNEQINAIKNQTKPSDEIIVFYNKGSEPQIEITDPTIKVLKLNYNTKFHARFAFALSAKNQYIAIFDDDTIPGNRWYESCLNSIEKQDGIYGTTGILLKTDYYNPHNKIGWNGIKPSEIMEVDLVGHSWFFKKEHLKYMWAEEPVSWDNGEDIQFSALAQIYGGIKTYVPPHPINDMSIWGSMKGSLLGEDNFASYKLSQHATQRDNIVNEYIKKGWVPVWKR